MSIGEVWKEIPWAPGYDVSTIGGVRCWRKPTRYGGYYIVPKMVKPILSRGRRMVNIGGRIRNISVLVLDTFVGPRPDGMECCHGPNGTLDDSLDNLSWGTHHKNMQDKFRDGTQPLGEASPLAKLTDEGVREIIALRKLRWTYKRIADKMGLSLGTIWHVTNGKTWKHITATIDTPLASLPRRIGRGR